mmetsp:Transcript_9529/g.24737  ORF Transcript_9529/g.24737 Transcript_9529/m.24737 type:complete len:181 (+) Transcript_9529:290-832(+)
MEHQHGSRLVAVVWRRETEERALGALDGTRRRTTVVCPTAKCHGHMPSMPSNVLPSTARDGRLAPHRGRWLVAGWLGKLAHRTCWLTSPGNEPVSRKAPPRAASSTSGQLEGSYCTRSPGHSPPSPSMASMHCPLPAVHHAHPVCSAHRSHVSSDAQALPEPPPAAPPASGARPLGVPPP